MGIHKTSIVAIGNSQGVRIPKPLLEEAGLEGDIELVAEEGRILIRPLKHPRQGWDTALAKMATAGDDQLLDADLPAPGWDREEWQW